MSLGCCTSIFCASALSANKTQTVAEVISKNNNGNNLLGFVYGYETSQNTFEICTVQPELSKELRSVNRDREVYDVYPSEFNGCSPGIVNYSESTSDTVAFLLQPKENYTNSYFDPLYSFELLCGKTDKESNTEDIYINQKYADYLIKTRGLLENDYTSLLLNPEIKIPYKNKHTSSKEMTYIIKGVLNDNSEKYQQYKKYFGDFFLANQYLSLPLSNGTCFTIPNTVNDLREYLDLIYRIYDYKVAGRYFDALSFTYKYDYRTVGIGHRDTTQSITQLFSENNSYFSEIKQIYDYFFNKQYIIPFVFLLVLDLIILLLSFWVIVRIMKNTMPSMSLLIILLSCAVSVFIGLLLNKISLLSMIINVPLSTKSWQAFVAMAVQILMVVAISTILNFVRLKNLKLKNNKQYKK